MSFKEANEAEFFSISEKEGVALATPQAWQHQAKDIRKHLGRTLTQQLRNMSRDTGPEFYACLSGLKSTTVDWSELHSPLHVSLTPSQVHIFLENLLCVRHVSPAPFARGVRGQTTLGKLFCAQVPCVMIHFQSQGAVLVARNRLLDVKVEALAIEPEQSESSNTPRRKKRKVEERIPEILDVLGNALDELTDARAHKRRHDDVHHVDITAPALRAYCTRKGYTLSFQAVGEFFFLCSDHVNARKFNGLLPWRLYNRKQDVHADHIDAHYLCSQVRLICEIALESFEATIFSVDTKALVRCGPDIPAVSEKNKVKEFSPCTPAAKPKHDGMWQGGIHLPDHTWAPELTIHPFGILRVEGDMGIEFDKLNRPRGKIPRRGPWTFNLLYESNSFLDASGLLKQVKEANKTVTVCIVNDCKQDLGPAGLVTFFAWAHPTYDFTGQNVTLLRKYPKKNLVDCDSMFFRFSAPKIGGVLTKTF